MLRFQWFPIFITISSTGQCKQFTVYKILICNRVGKRFVRFTQHLKWYIFIISVKMIWDMSPVKIYVSHNLFVLYIIPRQKDVTSCKQSKWLLQAIKMTTLLLPWKEFKSSQRITKFHLNQTTIFKFHQLQWFNNNCLKLRKQHIERRVTNTIRVICLY